MIVDLRFHKPSNEYHGEESSVTNSPALQEVEGSFVVGFMGG